MKWIIGTTWRRLKPGLSSRGYPSVSLIADGELRRFSVHHLVLTAFVGPRPPGMQACHNNGNKTDNSVANLRWDTGANNEADKIKHGTRRNGERCPWSVVDETVVKEIRRLKAAGFSLLAIERKTGVKRNTARRIVLGTTWAHVPWEQGTSPLKPKPWLPPDTVREIRRMSWEGMSGSAIARTLELNDRTVRWNRRKALAEKGPEGVTILLQGTLRPGPGGLPVLEGAGISAVPRSAAPTAPTAAPEGGSS